MTETQARAVVAMAKTSLNITKASRMMHYCDTGIYYHLCTIKKQTGLDPRNFFDLVKLYNRARKVLLSGDPIGTERREEDT